MTPPESATPECDRLQTNALDCNDLRAWQTLARSLETRLRAAEAELATEREMHLAICQSYVNDVRSANERRAGSMRDLDQARATIATLTQQLAEAQRLKSALEPFRYAAKEIYEALAASRPKHTPDQCTSIQAELTDEADLALRELAKLPPREPGMRRCETMFSIDSLELKDWARLHAAIDAAIAKDDTHGN